MPESKYGAGIEITASDKATPALQNVGSLLASLSMGFGNFGQAVARSSPAMGGAVQGLSGLTGGIGGLSGVLKSVPPLLLGIGAAVGAATIAFTKLNEIATKVEQTFRQSLGAYTAFEEKLLEVQTIVRGTDEELARIGDTAVGMSTRFGTTASQQLTGFYQTASAGFGDYRESVDIMSTANKLAVAGVTDITSSINLLTGTIRSYGMEAQDAQHVSDILFKLVEKGKTTIPELAGKFAMVAPIAGVSGVSLEETAAALAAVTATGMPTAQAVTSVAGMIRSLTKITPEARKAMEKYGVELSAQRVQNEGLLPVLKDIKGAVGGNVGALRELIREEEGFRAVGAITGDMMGYYEDSLGAMQQATGSTTDAVDTMSGSLAYQQRRWASLKESLMIGMGEVLGKAVQPLFGGLMKVVDAIGNLPAPIKKAIYALGGFAGAVPLLTNKFFGLVWSLGKTFIMVSVLTFLFATMWPAIVLVGVATVGLVAALGELVYTFKSDAIPEGKGFIDVLKQIGSAIKFAAAFIRKGEISGALAEEFMESEEWVRQLALKIEAVWDAIKVGYEAGKEVVVTALRAIGDSMGGTLGKVADWVRGFLSGEKTAKEFAKELPVEKIKELGTKVGEAVVLVLRLGKAFFDAAVWVGALAVKIGTLIERAHEAWENPLVRAAVGATLGAPLGFAGMAAGAIGFAARAPEAREAVTPESKRAGAIVTRDEGPAVTEGPGPATAPIQFQIFQQSRLEVDGKELASRLEDLRGELTEERFEPGAEMSIMTQ